MAEVQSGSYRELLALPARFWLVTIGYMATASIPVGHHDRPPGTLKVARHFSWSTRAFFRRGPIFLGNLSRFWRVAVSDKWDAGGYWACWARWSLSISVHHGLQVLQRHLYCHRHLLLGWVMPVAWTLLQSLVAPNLVGEPAGLMNGVSNGFAALAPISYHGLFDTVLGSYLAGMVYLMVVGAAIGLQSLRLRNIKPISLLTMS